MLHGSIRIVITRTGSPESYGSNFLHLPTGRDAQARVRGHSLRENDGIKPSSAEFLSKPGEPKPPGFVLLDSNNERNGDECLCIEAGVGPSAGEEVEVEGPPVGLRRGLRGGAPPRIACPGRERPRALRARGAHGDARVADGVTWSRNEPARFDSSDRRLRGLCAARLTKNSGRRPGAWT